MSTPEPIDESDLIANQFVSEYSSFYDYQRAGGMYDHVVPDAESDGEQVLLAFKEFTDLPSDAKAFSLLTKLENTDSVQTAISKLKAALKLDNKPFIDAINTAYELDEEEEVEVGIEEIQEIQEDVERALHQNLPHQPAEPQSPPPKNKDDHYYDDDCANEFRERMERFLVWLQK